MKGKSSKHGAPNQAAAESAGRAALSRMKSSPGSFRTGKDQVAPLTHAGNPDDPKYNRGRSLPGS